MRSGTGRELGAVPNGPAGEPERGSVIVRRGWLHQVIREAAARRRRAVHVRRAPGLDRRDRRPGCARRFADGRVAEGDILIGADGIGSPTRRWIDPAAPQPRYSGLVGTGGYARVDRARADTRHAVLRVRCALVLRLPGARGRHGLLVREHDRAAARARVAARRAERGVAREAARPAQRRPVPGPADPRARDGRGRRVPDLRPGRRDAPGAAAASSRSAMPCTPPRRAPGRARRSRSKTRSRSRSACATCPTMPPPSPSISASGSRGRMPS